MVLSCEIINRSKFFVENGFHPEDAIIIVLEGSFLCNTHNKEYTVSQNEIFFFKRHDTFKRRIIKPITAVCIVFDELPFDSNKKITPLYHTRITESIEFLVKSIKEGDTLLTEHFITDILYCFSHNAKKEDPIILEVIRYMEKHYNQNISLDQLASTFNISKQWLILRFKKEMNTTPINYLNNFRFKKAKELLLLKEMSISEVAFACGFDTLYYFTNAFKKHFGVSPGNWQKNMML